MERRVGEQRPSDGGHGPGPGPGPGPDRKGKRHSGEPLPPGHVTNYVARPLPKIPTPRPPSSSSSNYESDNNFSRDPSPTRSIPDYSSLVQECGSSLDPEGFAKIRPPKPAQKLSVKTDQEPVSPISPSTPTESWKWHVVSPGLPFTPGGSVDMPELIESYKYSPRRVTYDRAGTGETLNARNAGRTQPPHACQVPSSLRVPRQPPDNKPAHRRSDPGSPLAREVLMSDDTARDTSHQNVLFRTGQIGAPVIRARSHEEQRAGSLASGLAPPSNYNSQPGPSNVLVPVQRRPPPSAVREKKISFAGPKVTSYLNRTRVSKQTPPPPPPRLHLSSNRTTEGHIRTPFPASTFDSDDSGDDEGDKDKKARKFPSLSALVSHNLPKPRIDSHHRGLGGLMSRVSHRFSSEDPKRDKRSGGNTQQQDVYLRAAEAVRQPPPGDEHNWI